MTDNVILPDGMYPFINEMFPLSELRMIEVPVGLKTILVEQAKKNAIDIIRDAPVEIRCLTQEFGDALFMIYWPTGEEMHMLAPKKFQKGTA